jgi:hypothetical protein
MRCGLILSLLIAMPCWSQTTTTGQAQATGPCSPAATGSNNIFTINCGIGKEQGAALLKIVNKILSNQLNTNAVMTKLEELEKAEQGNEEQLFESLNGRLLPANDPMPTTQCGPPSKDQYVVALNGGGHMFTKFPHTILVYNGNKAVWLDKKQDGSIALYIDIRDQDGRILIRIDKDGFVVHPGSNLFARRPDKNSLVIQNDFGVDVLSVRYANPQAFVVTGTLAGLGPTFGCMNGDFTGIIFDNRPLQP